MACRVLVAAVEVGSGLQGATRQPGQGDGRGRDLRRSVQAVKASAGAAASRVPRLTSCANDRINPVASSCAKRCSAAMRSSAGSGMPHGRTSTPHWRAGRPCRSAAWPLLHCRPFLRGCEAIARRSSAPPARRSMRTAARGAVRLGTRRARADRRRESARSLTVRRSATDGQE